MTTILKKLRRKDEAKTVLIKNPDGEKVKKEKKSSGLARTFSKASDHLLSSAFSLSSSHGSKHGSSSKHSSGGSNHRSMRGRQVPTQQWASIASGCSHMEGGEEQQSESSSTIYDEEDDSFSFDRTSLPPQSITKADAEPSRSANSFAVVDADETLAVNEDTTTTKSERLSFSDPAFRSSNSFVVHADEKLLNEDTTTTKSNRLSFSDEPASESHNIVGNQRDSFNFDMSVSRFDLSVAQFDLGDLNKLELTPEQEGEDEEPKDDTKTELVQGDTTIKTNRSRLPPLSEQPKASESHIVGNQRDSFNFEMSVSRFDVSVAQFDLGDLQNLKLRKESSPLEEDDEDECPNDDSNKEEHEFSARFSANFGDEPATSKKLQAFLEEEEDELLEEDEDIEDSCCFTVRPASVKQRRLPQAV